MEQIINKVKEAVKSLEKEHGSLLICALFLREEPLEKWDVVVSASWLSSKKLDSYKKISAKLQEFLSEAELLKFSRVVLLDQNDAVIKYLLDLKSIKNGGYEELDREVLSDKFHFVIKRAYLLRSQK